jgi:hypothetical protein
MKNLFNAVRRQEREMIWVQRWEETKAISSVPERLITVYTG